MRGTTGIKSRSALCAALFMAAGFGPTGCASDEAAPRAAETYTPQPAPVTSQNLQQPAAQDQSVVASDTIKKKCQIPDSPQQSPQFDFDEADLRQRGENILTRVAQCMQEGALKGETLMLVGRADPRGSQSYNRALGMERARAVRDYLSSQGVAVSSLNVSSRGELDATGTGPASWQLDRRVDLRESTL